MNNDVAVIGSGLVGAAFALALAKKSPHLKIILIDRALPDFSKNQMGLDNKIYAISQRNFNYLQKIIEALPKQQIGVIDKMLVNGDSFGEITLDSNLANNEYLARTIEYRVLLKAILDELAKLSNVEICYSNIENIGETEYGVSIELLNGKMINTKWLVAADGANSLVRRKFNFNLSEIAYTQTGVVANFSCELDHQNVARQWFFEDSILAFLPLSDKKISIVWSCSNSTELLSLSNEDFTERISQASCAVLGKLNLITPAVAFPLKLNLVETFVKDRIILIGDAAHTVHPLAGQGVNLGFSDAWALVNLFTSQLIDKISPIDLQKYNSQRLIAVRNVQITCHTLQRLFSNQLPVLKLARNLGLNLINSSRLIKKLLIETAIKY